MCCNKLTLNLREFPRMNVELHKEPPFQLGKQPSAVFQQGKAGSVTKLGGDRDQASSFWRQAMALAALFLAERRP